MRLLKWQLTRIVGFVMDFGIRELLMFIGALIFIGVLIDGVRRFQQNRKTQIKIKVDRNLTSSDGENDIDMFSGELPSGGARFSGQEDVGRNEVDRKITPRFSEPVDVLMEQAPQKSAPSVDLNNFTESNRAIDGDNKEREPDSAPDSELEYEDDIENVEPKRVEESFSEGVAEEHYEEQGIDEASIETINVEKPQLDLYTVDPRLH